jgi:leucyl aminopeptidase
MSESFNGPKPELLKAAETSKLLEQLKASYKVIDTLLTLEKTAVNEIQRLAGHTTATPEEERALHAAISEAKKAAIEAREMTREGLAHARSLSGEIGKDATPTYLSTTLETLQKDQDELDTYLDTLSED